MANDFKSWMDGLKKLSIVNPDNDGLKNAFNLSFASNDVLQVML